MAFARVFSGTLYPGQTVEVLGPKYVCGAFTPFSYNAVTRSGLAGTTLVRLTNTARW